jgi:hypothetical protein
MADSGDAIRQQLIALLEQDEFIFTDTAFRDGMRLAGSLADPKRGFPSQYGLVDYVVERLKDSFPLNEVPMGEPPGSAGIAYSMTNTDGQGLYIKLKIEDDRVVILSFHVSKHDQGE